MKSINNWSNNFYSLGESFFSKINPSPLPNPKLISSSKEVAALIGLDEQELGSELFLNIVSGNHLLDSMNPLASVYSGHQFGIWAGQLGDGRAILLGEIDYKDHLWEIQLKGAGPTPYSRRADGRAVLRSSIREYLCSEAMAHLGIPTTRALSLVHSPMNVMRETAETTAVVARIAPSFIRFGHFEHFASQQRLLELKKLADFVIDHHFIHLRSENNPYLELLSSVIELSAKMVAHWQSIGFCHGVINTDNTSILGLTIDYGPFGFLDAFDLEHICNHTDTQGRYSFKNQVQVIHWNLVRLAEALLPLIATNQNDKTLDQAVELLKVRIDQYPKLYQRYYQEQMLAKLGISSQSTKDHFNSVPLIDSLIKLLHQHHIDYTFFFRNLSKFVANSNNNVIRDLFLNSEDWKNWSKNYLAHLKLNNQGFSEIAQKMDLKNPKFILRQYLLQTAIEMAEKGDYSEVLRLENLIKRPFDEQMEFDHYAHLPPDWAKELEVSCSS